MQNLIKKNKINKLNHPEDYMNKFSFLLKKNSNFSFATELIEAFDILMHLVPEQLTQEYQVKSLKDVVDLNVPSTSLGALLRQKLTSIEEKEKNHLQFSVEQQNINFELDLINEIKKNLNSVYFNQDKKDDTLKNIFKEQDVLLSLLKKIQPYFNSSKEQDLIFEFDKLMIGKSCKTSATGAIFTLLFHKSLKDDNAVILSDILYQKKELNMVDVLTLNPFLFSFYINQEKTNILKKLISQQDDQCLFQTIDLILQKRVNCGKFAEIILEEFSQRDLQLSQENKQELFNVFIKNNNYYKNIAKNDFKIVEKQATFEKLHAIFKNCDINLGYQESHMLHIAVKLSDKKVKDMNQYINILTSKDIKNQNLLNYFDLSSQNIVHVYKTLCIRYDEALIKNFVFSNIDKMAKNDIAEMVVFDKSKFNIIKDAILQLKLNEDLNLKDDTNKKPFVKI